MGFQRTDVGLYPVQITRDVLHTGQPFQFVNRAPVIAGLRFQGGTRRRDALFQRVAAILRVLERHQLVAQRLVSAAGGFQRGEPFLDRLALGDGRFIARDAPGQPFQFGQDRGFVAFVFVQAAGEIGQPVGGGTQMGRGILDRVVAGLGLMQGAFRGRVVFLGGLQVAFQRGLAGEVVLDLGQPPVDVAQRGFDLAQPQPGAFLVLPPGVQPQDVRQNFLALGRCFGSERVGLALL